MKIGISYSSVRSQRTTNVIGKVYEPYTLIRLKIEIDYPPRHLLLPPIAGSLTSVAVYYCTGRKVRSVQKAIGINRET